VEGDAGCAPGAAGVPRRASRGSRHVWPAVYAGFVAVVALIVPRVRGRPRITGTQISRNSSFIDTSPDTVSSLFLVETGSALKWGADTL
jgi:hypothetical protein